MIDRVFPVYRDRQKKVVNKQKYNIKMSYAQINKKKKISYMFSGKIKKFKKMRKGVVIGSNACHDGSVGFIYTILSKFLLPSNIGTAVEHASCSVMSVAVNSKHGLFFPPLTAIQHSVYGSKIRVE